VWRTRPTASQGSGRIHRGFVETHHARRQITLRPPGPQGRSADERHRMLVRRPLLRLRQSQPRMIPQRMTRPSRLVSRMALLRASRHERPCSIDRARRRSTIASSQRNVVSHLSASSASCATTAITGMLTSTTVMCRNGTPMLPMATLAVITHSGVAAGPSDHEHSSNRDAKEPSAPSALYSEPEFRCVVKSARSSGRGLSHRCRTRRSYAQPDSGRCRHRRRTESNGK
jgi:hypothetical protein